MARVAVGGTFEPLHDGHRKLLGRACEIAKGGELVLGLTSNSMARQRTRQVADFAIRKAMVEEFCTSCGVQPHIIELSDPFGPAIHEDFDYIVVSPETLPAAREINRIRKRSGLGAITIELVDYVLAADGKPISSTRIANGEIDEHGTILPRKRSG